MEAEQVSPVTPTRSGSLKDNTLLIVDDDRAFLTRLARAMETRGFEVEAAASVEDGLSSLKRRPPAFAVVDLRLDDGNDDVDPLPPAPADRCSLRIVERLGEHDVGPHGHLLARQPA